MIVKTDSYFHQGVTHEVCEDYALHGPHYAVVADGCSNGGGPRIDTDWGARLLCKAAEQHLMTSVVFNNSMEYAAAVCGTAQAQMHSIPNLIPESLTATLLTLGWEPGSRFAHTLLFGDGVFGGKRKDGTWEIGWVEFEKAPYYLRYRMFGTEQDYLEHFGGTYKVYGYAGELNYDLPEEWDFESQDEFWRLEGDWDIETKTLDLEYPCERFAWNAEDYEFLFIVSDGAHSFYEKRRTGTQKTNERVHVMDVLALLFDIVNYRPGFARNQKNWLFKQDRPNTFVRRNWHNGDDLSAGVICCE